MVTSVPARAMIRCMFAPQYQVDSVAPIGVGMSDNNFIV